MTELLALYAVVEAPPERVADLLLDVLPGGRSPMAARGVVEETGAGDDFVVVQGGSRVVHRVFNVASGHGWAVRFASRGPLNAAPASFAETVRELGERLGVAARVVD